MAMQTVTPGKEARVTIRMGSVRPAITSVVGVFIGTVAIGLAQQPPTPPVLERYQPVTAERLKNPEAGNWLMIRRTYDGWGYSPLDQITPQNVARLRPIWGFSTGETRVHESAPIVNNGVHVRVTRRTIK